MKPLLLLSLGLTVALGIPLSPHVTPSPVLTEGNLGPLLGDFVPAQGHVEVENPAPQPVLTLRKGQEPPSPEDQTENMVELEVKVKSEVQKKEEDEDGKEPKEKQEEGGIVELKLEVNPEAKEAEKLDTEAEIYVMEEKEAKIESEKEHEVESEPDLKVELQVKMDETGLREPEVVVMEEKAEEDQLEAETQAEDEDDTDFKVESETKVELETQEKEAKIESEKEHEVESEPDLKVELQVKMDETGLREPEVVVMEEKFEAAVAEEDQLEAETQAEDEDDTDFKVESETKVELETQEKEEVEEKLTSDQENLDKGREQMETAERHIDMESPHGALGHLFMESPEDDDRLEDEDDDSVLFEEQQQEEEEDVVKEDKHSDEQQVSEMEEPDVLQTFQQVSFSEHSPGEKEPFVVQEPRRGELEEEHAFDESAQKNHNQKIERRFCAGVGLDSKCYEFFKGPQTHKDAEYFCREHFFGGHLASITSPSIHREVLKLILEQNGSYTRVWVGGYRLDRNHFIWMDGSTWSYADWLNGEPNDTSGVEDCLEVLGSYGSEPGKFNDFTCWTPQAFICSYTY